MNLEHLYRFYVCANRKNITHAAEELFISQPALSKNINELEEELGGNLFVRKKTGITLTAVGKVLYDYIRPAIEIISNANKYIANYTANLEKTIKVGAPALCNKLILNDKIYNFLSEDKSYNLKLYEDKSEILFEKIKNNELDVILTYLEINDENYICKELLSLEDSFFCSTKNKSILQPLSIKELATMPLILNSESSSLVKAAKDYFWTEKLDLTLKYEINNDELFNELLVNNLAIGITSAKTVQKLIDENKIFKLELEREFTSRKINIIYKKNTNNYIKCFLDKLFLY